MQHAQRLDLVRSIGADHVIDYTREDFTWNGQRYDLILDNVASRLFSDLLCSEECAHRPEADRRQSNSVKAGASVSTPN